MSAQLELLPPAGRGLTQAQRAERYDFAKLGGHVSEQLLLEMLKAIRCDTEDEVYLALVEHIAAAERRRARSRSRMRRLERGGA